MAGARYAMLETLRAYGAGLLAEAGEQAAAAAALAAVRGWGWPGRPRRGCRPSRARRLRPGGWMPRTPPCARCWPGPWSTMRTSRCGWWPRWRRWWFLRGRLRRSVPAAAPGRRARRAGQRRVVHRAALARPGGADGRRTRPRRWATSPRYGTRPPSAGPCRALADALAGRSLVLLTMGRFAEAADDAGRALAVARELGYPVGEALALADLSHAALKPVTATVPATGPAGRADHGWRPRRDSPAVQLCLTDMLIAAGDLAAAEPICAAALARSRDAGDLRSLAALLP